MATLIAKRIRLCSVIAPALFFLALPAVGQMDYIYRFKGVEIPLTLKIDRAILEKGTYDLEFLRTPSPLLYYMRIMKKGKILHLVQGEEFQYPGGGGDRDIPDKPTLRMTKNVMRKSLTMIFESGRLTVIFPLLRARLELPYSED
jgi:hypothetical protein